MLSKWVYSNLGFGGARCARYVSFYTIGGSLNICFNVLQKLGNILKTEL